MGSRRSAWVLVVAGSVASWALVGLTASPAAAAAVLPYSTQMDAMSCPTTSDCWVVGTTPDGAGAVAHTTDGGTSWAPQPLPSGTSGLEGISCPTVTYCSAVGFSVSPQGVVQAVSIVATSDGGAVWRSQAVPSGIEELRGVFCATTSDCWAVGYAAPFAGVMLATTDGGAIWTRQTLPASVSELISVSCATPSDCWAVGLYDPGYDQGLADYVGVVVATGNGGATWSPETLPSGIETLDTVSCRSASDCVAVGYDGPSAVAVATTDGGSEWAADTVPGDLFGLYGLSCATTSRCWAVGVTQESVGAAVATANGGASWQPVSIPSVPNVFVGMEAASCPAVATCHLLMSTLGGFFVAGNFVLATTDGGAAWRFQFLPIEPPAGFYLAGRNGTVLAAGIPSLGNVPASAADPLAGMATTPDGAGWYAVTAHGVVTTRGDAPYEGDLHHPPGGGPPVQASDIVAIAPTADGQGYWLIGADGGMFAFGDARYHGSLPGLGIATHNVVGMVAAPDGAGYLVVAADGGVFAFGSARFFGSLPGEHVRVDDIRAVLSAPGGTGYLLVGADGGTFSFGHGAPFEGSLPGRGVKVTDVVGIALTPDDLGYWMAGADGNTYAFGDAGAVGRLPGVGSAVPIAAVAGT